jgi:hypothetical protein
MPKLPSKIPAISINLIPQDAFMESIVGKLLIWSLSIGRYIVVITEFAVIMSFVSRFKLDRDLTDLNSEIEKQKSIILAYQDVEPQFLATQKQINAIVKQQENSTLAETLSFLEKNLPIDVKLTQVSVQPTNWNINATALSAQSMKAAVDRIIKQNPEAAVSLSSVKMNAQTGAIHFIVRLEYQTVTTPVVSTGKTEETL